METESCLWKVFELVERNELREAQRVVERMEDSNHFSKNLALARVFVETSELEKALEIIENLKYQLSHAKFNENFEVFNRFLQICQCLLENAKNHAEIAHSVFKELVLSEKHPKFLSMIRTFCAKVCKKGLFSISDEKKVFLDEFNSSLNVTPNSCWHVVSTEWFSAWCSFVGAKAEDFKVKVPPIKPRSNKRPGPVDNSSIILKRSENESLQDPAHPYFSNLLKPGLSEGIDYLIMSDKAFDVLGNAYGVKQDVIRYAIEQNDTIYIIETYLKTVLVGYLNGSSLQVKKLATSRKNTVAYIKKIVLRQQNLQSRVWKVDLTRLPIERLQVLACRSFKTYLNGATVLDDRTSLDDAEVSESNLLLVEVNYKNYMYSDDPSLLVKKCAFCQTASQTVQCKLCQKKLYCSADCLAGHQEEHKKNCRVRPKRSVFSLFSCFCRQAEHSESEEEDPKMPSAGFPRSKIVGLQNLGNTCFMNSALQCLAAVNDLTSFFVRNEFKDYINKSNNLGTGGKLANEYADFLYCLSRTKEKSVAPWKLKKTISMFVSQFAGHQQHDSHEFLMFLISGLHEDLNQVTKKPYYSEDVKETDLMQMSVEYWKRFLSRNKSFIADLMYGQYKSTLVCPKCRGVSHTFDPFNCLSLPIPQLRSRRVVVKYIPIASPVVVFTFTLSESSVVQELVNKVVASIKQKPNFVLCLEMNSRTCEELDPQTPVQRLTNGHLLFYECFDEFQRYVVVKFRSDNHNALDCFPRIVKLDESSTYQDLHSKVFQTFASFCLQSEESLHYADFYQQGVYQIYSEPPLEHPCFVCRARRCKGCVVDDEMTTVSGYLRGKSFFSVLFYLRKSANKINFEFEPLRESVSMKPIDLTLRRDVSIYDCFSKFREPETLDKHNEWFCPKCKNLVQAEKRMEIYKLPKVLIIHLKRFKISGYSREKLNVPVTFPLDNLDLKQFTADTESLKPFELFAVSHHFGALAGGHYTATVKKDDRWFDCNDSEVTELKDQLNYSSSYVLFYRQTKQ